jgi:hypothetical protein
MSSLSKIVADEVQSFIELMFPSFKVFRGSRDESEAILESKQGLKHAKETNSSQDCCIQTSVQDQFTKAASVGKGAKIGTYDLNRFYQSIFPRIVKRSNSSSPHKF